MKLKVFVLAAIGVVLAGCASNNPVISHQEAVKSKEKAAAKAAKTQLDDMPDWYLNQTLSDTKGVYAAATAYTEDLEATIMKARLLAQYKLAKSVGVLVTGQERLYREASGSGNVKSSNETVIDSFVNQVKIAGWEVVDTKVYQEKSGFRVYTLLYMEYEDYDGLKVSASDAYKQLLKRAADASLEKQETQDMAKPSNESAKPTYTESSKTHDKSIDSTLGDSTTDEFPIGA